MSSVVSAYVWRKVEGVRRLVEAVNARDIEAIIALVYFDLGEDALALHLIRGRAAAR